LPWTEKQVAKLLGKDSPLNEEQKRKMQEELDRDPSLGKAKKGSPALKRK
jgi:uncharacterized protein YneF (UPF0154 family)